MILTLQFDEVILTDSCRLEEFTNWSSDADIERFTVGADLELCRLCSVIEIYCHQYCYAGTTTKVCWKQVYNVLSTEMQNQEVI